MTKFIQLIELDKFNYKVMERMGNNPDRERCTFQFEVEANIFCEYLRSEEYLNIIVKHESFYVKKVKLYAIENIGEFLKSLPEKSNKQFNDYKNNSAIESDMRNFHYTSINCKTSTKKILALSIELEGGEELDELGKKVKLSR